MSARVFAFMKTGIKMMKSLGVHILVILVLAV